MMKHKHSTLDDMFDPLDDDEEMDEFDGFHLDTDPRLCYGVGEGEPPVCLFEIGDSDGLCIREKYGCHVEGCEYAEQID